MLWRIDPLLSDESVNSGRCYVTPRNIHARNNRTMVLRNPFLSNGSVNTPLYQQSNCWRRRFLSGPCNVVMKKIGGTSSIEGCQFSWAVQGRLRRDIVTVEFTVDKRTWAREAEESPLLEAVAKERLVKTQQAGKGLAGAMVICEVWRLAIALYLLAVPNGVYK
jgi:hypothetical protein